MSFLEHCNDITNLIDDIRTGVPVDVNIYGYALNEYKNPINFWASYKINEDMSNSWVELSNPLVIQSSDFDINNQHFETKCVGYAVEKNYDSVIIETESTSYYITLDFSQTEYMIEGYLQEAPRRTGPLANKRLPKRDELLAKRKKKNIKKTPTAPIKGISVEVLLANTGRLSPDRVSRAMKGVSKRPPKIIGVKDVGGNKYIRAQYNFKSKGSTTNQIGYADISQDKSKCSEMFCTCADFYMRLYAPYVAAGLATWDLPNNFKSKQSNTVKTGPHNKKWTAETNPEGKLFLCKHLWAFMAYYVKGSDSAMDDAEIDDVIDKYFVDIDNDGEEEAMSDFMDAYGKLYVGKQGQEIDWKENPEDVEKGKRQTYYQLPKGERKTDDEPDDEETEEETDEE